MSLRGLVGGVPVTFASPAEAEDCDIIVCLPWSTPPRLRDNVRARCGGCGKAVQHRPDAPRKPMRICVDCAMQWVRQS